MVRRQDAGLDAEVAARLDQELDHGGPGTNGLLRAFVDDPDQRPDVLDHLGRRASEGHGAALEALVDAVQRHDIVGPAVRRLVVDRDDVDDVRQDVLIALTRSIGTYEGRARFTTWLGAIARNTAIGHLRRRREEHTLDDRQPSDNQRLSSMIASRGTLQDAVDALPDKYRLPVKLRDVEQLTYEDIAERLDLNLNTTRSRIARGRALLATQLDASFDRSVSGADRSTSEVGRQ